MLSSLLTDMCLDTINSTTKFSPVISRCNFAGVNGMSLHLQTEKLESITLSWQLSAAPPLLQPGRARSSARRFYPATAAPFPVPLPARPPRPAQTLPPGARGSSTVTGKAGPRTGRSPRRSPRCAPPRPRVPGGRGRPAAPARPSPAPGTARLPGERRAAAGWELTWG